MRAASTPSLQATASTTHARAGASTLQMSLAWQLRLEQGDRVEIQCARCGYGAVVASPPRRCPMCGGDGWRLAKRARPLPRLKG
jgi:rubrerythrin